MWNSPIISWLQLRNQHRSSSLSFLPFDPKLKELTKFHRQCPPPPCSLPHPLLLLVVRCLCPTMPPSSTCSTPVRPSATPHWRPLARPSWWLLGAPSMLVLWNNQRWWLAHRPWRACRRALYPPLHTSGRRQRPSNRLCYWISTRRRATRANRPLTRPSRALPGLTCSVRRLLQELPLGRWQFEF